MEALNIPNGEAVTGSLVLKDQSIVALVTPDAWTPADLMVEGSLNGADFLPVADAAGDLLNITVDAGRIIVLPPEATRGVPYVRFRSVVIDGEADVNQAEARQLLVETVK